MIAPTPAPIQTHRLRTLSVYDKHEAIVGATRVSHLLGVVVVNKFGLMPQTFSLKTRSSRLNL